MKQSWKGWPGATPFSLDDGASRPRPWVMGIVNVTEDSFSDGGRFVAPDRAVAHGLELARDGAALVDVGGESTRPGAVSVPVALEMARVIPVVKGLVERGIAVSVDTMKPEVMSACAAAGAVVLNDVNAFRAPGAVEAVAKLDVGLVVMHMQGTPQTMQQAPHYGDVVAEVGDFLVERARVLESAGVARERIAFDPGFGFGKTLEHNKALFNALPRLANLGYPVVAGVSRKRMIADLTGRGVGERTAGSVAAALLAAQNGARVLRVHDVRETVDALNVWMGMR